MTFSVTDDKPTSVLSISHIRPAGSPAWSMPCALTSPALSAPRCLPSSWTASPRRAQTRPRCAVRPALLRRGRCMLCSVVALSIRTLSIPPTSAKMLQILRGRRPRSCRSVIVIAFRGDHEIEKQSCHWLRVDDTTFKIGVVAVADNRDAALGSRAGGAARRLGPGRHVGGRPP